jgi:hypothetical protein
MEDTVAAARPGRFGDHDELVHTPRFDHYSGSVNLIFLAQSCRPPI